ncbi:hypothetical protein Taro_017520 [Colocasia esculenta]|uniref:Acid phosphatase n=1 Tax=Colocasia esculenta TaxID=4460 RepID=A0A843UND3_COLES|nr:hypothetical protein [Colocasia esculenta]
MDRGGSARSLLSERGSDAGSHYAIESGFYISSFAAIIFVSGITIVGVLLLSLVVALVVMLQSCENHQSSVFQQWRNNDMFDYCNIFASHMELNNLESEEFPAVCKAYANSYTNEGQYLMELNMSIQVAENYFSVVTPENNFSVILMDVDDILPPHIMQRSKLPEYRSESEEVKGLAQGLVRRLYTRLQNGGWSLVLFTREPENQRSGTVDSLTAAGYEGWSSLMMRSKDELLMGSWEYITSRRMELQNQGFTIACVISSRMDALTGPSAGKRNFKLASGHWPRITDAKERP